MFHIKEIGLLGSCARGENNENSDSLIETTLSNKKLAKTIQSLKNGLSAAISKIEIKNVVNEFKWILKFAESNTRSYDLFSNALDFPEQFAKKHKRTSLLHPTFVQGTILFRFKSKKAH